MAQSRCSPAANIFHFLLTYFNCIQTKKKDNWIKVIKKGFVPRPTEQLSSGADCKFASPVENE